VINPKAAAISDRLANDPPLFILALQVPHNALMATVLVFRGVIVTKPFFATLGQRQQ
jgi:hypothetical protein